MLPAMLKQKFWVKKSPTAGRDAGQWGVNVMPGS